MVAVEMGDEDGVERADVLVVEVHLVLGSFAAVEQHLEAADVYHLRTAVTTPCGSRGARA